MSINPQKQLQRLFSLFFPLGVVSLGLLAGGMLAGGCSNETVIAVGGGAEDGDTKDGEHDSSLSPDRNPDFAREIIVLHDTSIPLQVRVGEVPSIRVKLIDYEMGGPVQDSIVQFALSPDPGSEGGDASFGSASAYTDSSGVANVLLRAGLKGEMAYTVKVSASQAEAVEFGVFVAESPRGSLRVLLNYEGAIDIKNMHVRLAPSSYNCNQFNPVYPPQEVIAEKTVLGLRDGAVVWDNLPESQRFVVFATAESMTGSLAAAGCVEGVVVLPNEENVVNLNLFLLTLNPFGTYDNTSIFDFTGAIPGQLGQLVNEITLLFNNPGQFLINQIKSLISNYIGTWLTDVVFGTFENALANVITNWMLNDAPSWVQTIFTVGQDLTQIANNLELLADLNISKLGNNYYVQGTLNWKGVVLYWRYGCAREGSANYDPECGRNVFSMEQFSNTQFPMNIIEGKFTAMLSNFDQFDIDNHVIRINYGRLIVFILNELILPAVAGQHNITDTVLAIVNCRSIAERIYFSALGNRETAVTRIANACTDAIEFVTRPITMILSSLAIDSQLRLSGHAIMVDEDNDLSVDYFKDGSYIGNFESDGQSGAPFTGTWTAILK